MKIIDPLEIAGFLRNNDDMSKIVATGFCCPSVAKKTSEIAGQTRNIYCNVTEIAKIIQTLAENIVFINQGITHSEADWE